MLSLIICAESAAAFDLLTRSSADDEMVQQNKDRWPNTFRAARFVPAVEYLNACRMRYQIMKKMDPLIDGYDVIVTPPETGDQWAVATDGDPPVTLPNGFLPNGMPSGITFIGKHFDEADLTRFCKSISGTYRVSFKTSACVYEMRKSIYFSIDNMDPEMKYFPGQFF